MTFKALIKCTAALLCLIPALSFAQSNWEEGEHYEIISDTASETKNIREVFSFWCPHCFTFETIVTELKSKLPDDVTFIKAHANMAPAASDATRAMLSAKAMGQADVFNAALFNAIHKQRRNVAGMQDIKDIFSQAGGDGEKLEKMATSFGIRSQERKNDQLTKGVSSVPTFIVNDKYQAIFGRDMTPDQFVQLVLWLTKQK
ncbi:thiol:disulfide interchange protein DsbA/DsbL [Aliiglaciecola sp. LCG003]|uniref:thiol:disulfide interchange protein DsbA/DsbL n=1 Tax=Aliiglaciecola sp. LCG003 TaxID=3053655 RepID=UPI0025747E77|nr:thiol:disulfide interchange protein DsbA/DsbL [Aliiglaciecola sp. LCG003]WJG08801.1 thiol:disulfide interchange protein DsbA/DsbL [Aliiglaciecola sp. LCG003]